MPTTTKGIPSKWLLNELQKLAKESQELHYPSVLDLGSDLIIKDLLEFLEFEGCILKTENPDSERVIFRSATAFIEAFTQLMLENYDELIETSKEMSQIAEERFEK